MNKFLLKTLKLKNFRNYLDREFSFIPAANVICGDNGTGKTSILEAINYLSIGKSTFSATDKDVLNKESDFFRIEGNFTQGEFETKVVIKYDKKKNLEVNGVEEKSLKEFIGSFPSVCISPKDILIIIQGSQARRRLIDQTLGQQDKAYLFAVIKYRSLLKQRNSFLKQQLTGREIDNSQLDTYNEQMIPLATLIHEKRNQFVMEFNLLFQDLYSDISNEKEKAMISYKSQLSENKLDYLLYKETQLDIASRKTNSGTHRDDLVMLLEGQNLRTYGSQGQQKSFVLAMRLAQYQWLNRHADNNPILLLDDIYDKLDDHRVRSLIKMISKDWDTQLFITDTDKHRLVKLLSGEEIKYKQFVIEKTK